MKKAAMYILLFSFLGQCTSSLWTVVYFYANREYIANNICINRFDAIPVCKGQCYLGQQLEQNEKQEQKVPEIKLREIQLFLATAEIPDTYAVPLTWRNSPQDTFPPYCFISRVPDAIFHPPKQV